jgi:hypothetical protein
MESIQAGPRTGEPTRIAHGSQRGAQIFTGLHAGPAEHVIGLVCTLTHLSNRQQAQDFGNAHSFRKTARFQITRLPPLVETSLGAASQRHA